MTMPYLISNTLIESEAWRYEKAGYIDDLSNINADKVYIFSGKKDSVVYNGVVEKLETLYKNLNADVKVNYNVI